MRNLIIIINNNYMQLIYNRINNKDMQFIYNARRDMRNVSWIKYMYIKRIYIAYKINAWYVACYKLAVVLS